MWQRRDRRPEDLPHRRRRRRVSLIAWLALVVVPAWKSYWRVRDRLVATLLSVYILAAFVLAGAGVGAAALVLLRPPVDV